jgi:hypothetical protein
MRKLNQIMLLIMTVSLVTFTSCSSEDDNDGGNDNGDEFLTATIDGNGFSAAQSPAVIIGAQSTNGILSVQGGDNTGNTVSMAVMNYTGVGTYVTGDVISNTNFIQYLTISGTPSTWASGLSSAALGTLMPGTIEVTSDDGTTVEGTFSFEGYNGADMTTKVVTNGEFKAILD